MSSWNWEDRRRKGLRKGGQSDVNNIIIVSPFFSLSLLLPHNPPVGLTLVSWLLLSLLIEAGDIHLA